VNRASSGRGPPESLTAAPYRSDHHQPLRLTTAAATSFYEGGEGGIRTHGTVSRSGAFKAPALVHYATSPQGGLALASSASIQILADTCRKLLQASERTATS
jgi:hypothetical protein